MRKTQNASIVDLADIRQTFRTVSPVTKAGRVTETIGPSIRATLGGVAIGDFVRIKRRLSHLPQQSKFGSANPGDDELVAQVVGFSNQSVVLSPFQNPRGVYPGAEVLHVGAPPSITVGAHLLGSVVDPLGRLLYSDLPETSEIAGLSAETNIPPALTIMPFGTDCTLNNSPPAALSRRPISRPFVTGVRAIDAFVTIGVGQRLAVFAEPGVGKSTLMGMIAKNATVDINIIALIGERGREVSELIFDTLDSATRRKTVAIISTSDEPAISRVYAALTATTIAEYFRDLGFSVLLQMDSLTRLCRALREVGLAAGEPPVRRGYPPSVFAELPRLIERTGTAARGAITALYTVLLSEDADEDPMVEEIKSLTDGHLMLKRELAERGHYPAIDILGSISRLSMRLQEPAKQGAISTVRAVLSRLAKDRDLAVLGSSIDDELKRALALEPQINRFLMQQFDEISPTQKTWEQLFAITARIPAVC